MGGGYVSERLCAHMCSSVLSACVWVCCSSFHLPNLYVSLIHSDLSIVREQMSWVQSYTDWMESTEAVSLFSTLFPWLSPFILIPVHCYSRGARVKHTHAHTLIQSLGQRKGARERGLSLLLWSKHSSILSVPLPPSITLPLLNHSPPISAEFIHEYYLTPRPAHTGLHTQISISSKFMYIGAFFSSLWDQLDRSRNEKMCYETRADLDTYATVKWVTHTHIYTVGQPVPM